MPHIILIACHLYFDLRVWYNVHNTFFVAYSSQAFHGFDYTNNPEQMFNLLFITANETSWKLNSSLQKWHGFQWNECIKYILAVGIKRNAPIVQFCIVLREQLIYNIMPWTKVLIINYDSYIKGFETKVWSKWYWFQVQAQLLSHPQYWIPWLFIGRMILNVAQIPIFRRDLIVARTLHFKISWMTIKFPLDVFYFYLLHVLHPSIQCKMYGLPMSMKTRNTTYDVRVIIESRMKHRYIIALFIQV